MPPMPAAFTNQVDRFPLGDRADPPAAERIRRRHARRKCKEQDIVLSAREREIERIGGEGPGQIEKSIGERQRIGVDLRSRSTFAAEAMQIAGHAVRNIHAANLRVLLSKPSAQFELRPGEEMPAYCLPGGALQRGRDDCRASAIDQDPARGRFSDSSSKPQIVARPRSVAMQPAPVFRFRSDQRERRDESVAAGEVATRERDAVPAAGPCKGPEEPIVIETGGSGEREKGPGGIGAHGREIRKIDREEPPGHVRGIEIRNEMDAFDLGIDGDRDRSGGRKDRGVVADRRGRTEPSAQATEQLVLSVHTAAV